MSFFLLRPTGYVYDEFMTDTDSIGHPKVQISGGQVVFSCK